MQLLHQVLSILLLHAVREIAASCSVFCACKWKNGKQTVECADKSLPEIPEGMDPETQVLEFSGNKLNKLSKELFLKKQLVNLQRLYLSTCKIKSVHKDTFKGLTNLVELDLSDNLLENVPSAALLNCPALMKLTLNFNPVSQLKKLAFNHLSYLNTLELSNCQISEIEEGAFQGLHSLEWLRLDGNRLKTIRGRRTLPENVKGVDLQKNPWECDCHIQELSAWLGDFSVPLSVEPTCQGPPRLAGRLVESIPPEELACLPDISPTSFYLELGEGRNVSLTCHVHAIPEASVSWWFQGKMLQNNTMVAPGLHLVYFIEEGVENKRSELFIYNVNAGDNGTFVCVADNAAGSSQSNFTIKIILKEDPIVIIVAFSLEYFLLAAIGISALGVLVLVVVAVSIVRCHRRSRRQQKRDQTKEVALQYQQNVNKPGDNVECLMPDPAKINTPSPNCEEEATPPPGYCVLARDQTPSDAAPLTGAADWGSRSPAAHRRPQPERNPDLINGTESIGCRREGDGEDVALQGGFQGERGVAPATAVAAAAAAFPIACLRGSAEFYADMRCIVDPEGYPIDYGLPKIACRTQCASDGYYRTLPINRIKRHSAANPLKRFSREAEFLSRSGDAPYDYQTDVRYTADGYPVRPPNHKPQPTLMEKLPPTDAAAPSSLPCCSDQWPACVPANLHIVNCGSVGGGLAPVAGFPARRCVTKRCVGAQTDTESDAENPENSGSEKRESAANVENDPNDTLTESPDEGYEGEPSVV